MVVTCADQDTTKAAPRDYLTAPALIVEVLSEATENIDRREKMRAYALLDSRKAQAELYRKRPEGDWEQWIVTPGETLTLTSVGLDMAVEDFYEDTDL